MKKKENEKNVHDGHRARLLDLACNAGVDNMSKYQVLEFFLTYIFPRGDVNPLAHKLLDEYESFTHIIDADVNDLMRVTGLNERSAKKISMFSELFYYYATAKMSRKCVVSCVADLIDIVEDNLRFRTTENMILLALSPANIVTHKRRIKTNSSNEVGLPVLELTNFLSSTKAAALVVAHCHPYGKSVPSLNDENGFKLIRDVCQTCGVNFIDSFIVGEDGVFSQRKDGLVRTYYDIDQLKRSIEEITGT
ncbi:MAG: hypothetical protein K2K31_03380 [Clostridia bacterium]|nr:hypothetical protein [Clostridia bacterium]